MGGLVRYLTRRSIQAIITLFIITSITWALFEGMPGDPTDQLYGNPNLKATQIAEMAVRYGLADKFEKRIENFKEVSTYMIGNTERTLYRAGEVISFYTRPRVIIPIWNSSSEAGKSMLVFIKTSDDGRHWDKTKFVYYLIEDSKISTVYTSKIADEINADKPRIFWVSEPIENILEIEEGKVNLTLVFVGRATLKIELYYGSKLLSSKNIIIDAADEKTYYLDMVTTEKYIFPGDRFNLTITLVEGGAKVIYGTENSRISYNSLFSKSLKNGDRIQYVGAIPKEYVEFFVVMVGEYKPVPLRVVYVIDKPLIERYGNYIKNMFTFNFGYSNIYNKPVVEVLSQAIPRTILWFGIATVLQYLIGIILGSYIAWKRGSIAEGSVIVSSLFFYNMPSFWIGLIFIWVFSFYLGWFPLGGFCSGNTTGPGSTCAKLGICPGHPLYAIVDIGWHLALPMIVILVLGMAGVTLLMRTTMLETVSEDYIVTAKAKGLPERVVKNRHARRNAMLPIVTSFVIAFSFAIGGAVILEQIFSYQGVGQMYIGALLSQDQFLAGASLFIISTLVVIGNLIADVLYGYLDPRVRVG